MKHDLGFILSLLAPVVMLVVIGIMHLKANRSKQAQNKLIQSLGKDAASSWFRIRVSRPAFFKRRMKLLGFEASGILVSGARSIRIMAELEGGKRIEKDYAKDSLHLVWIGNPGLGSSNLHWISVGQGGDQLMVSADTGFNAVQSREATADICRKILPEFELPSAANVDFALEKNRASLIGLCIFFGLIAYALIDGFFLNNNELLKLGWLGFAMPSLGLLAIPAYFALVQGKVPSRESLAMSMMLAAAFTAAFVPAVKRVDQAMSGGPKQYQFKLIEGTRLEAVDPGPPDLNFRKAKEYWAQYDEGSIHQFSLIHGPLGLWQLDSDDLLPKVRAFYQKLDGKGDK